MAFSGLFGDLDGAPIGSERKGKVSTDEFNEITVISNVKEKGQPIGGLGNLGGTVAAAVLLAFLEGVITSFADPTAARIASLCLMSAVLMFRPHGIFVGSTR